MATALQKNLANEIVKNAKRKKPLNRMQLVEASGYSHNTAIKQPVIEQKGVQDELKSMGFTEENAKAVVTEILLSKKVKPDTRIRAAQEVFKVEGSYAAEKSVNLNVEAKLDDTTGLESIRQEYEAKLKAKLLQ